MKRILLCLLALLLLSGCQAQTAHSAVGLACDTVVTITAYAPQETVDETLRICADYEALLSKTIEGSDVWNLNHAGGAPVEVHPETAALLKLAVEIGEYSGGAFDITIAPVSGMWDFAADVPVVPDPDALLAAARRVDYRNARRPRGGTSQGEIPSCREKGGAGAFADDTANGGFHNAIGVYHNHNPCDNANEGNWDRVPLRRAQWQATGN